jgi:putative peptidoglycan lipid II flippase
VIAEGLIPGDGAVGTLFLGNRLMQLPLAVFALSIATAALPELSSRAAGKGKGAFQKTLRGATGSILFWVVPAAVGLALLAQPITALLFDRGAFYGSSGALPKTSLVVIFYAPGLVAFGVSALYARALYARGEPKAVMRAALWSVGVNVVFNLALVILFQRIELAPGPGAGVRSGEAGLALASSASGFAYLAILASSLRGGERPERRGLLLAAAALAGGVLTALATRGLLEGETLARPWNWMWLAPKLPVAVCVGAFAATIIVLGGTDAALAGPVARTSLTAAGMGVFANLVLSSLQLEGHSWAMPFERAIAPVVLGAVSYWFLAGFIAAPEYERARSALAGALRLRARRRSGGTGPAADSGTDEAP